MPDHDRTRTLRVCALFAALCGSQMVSAQTPYPGPKLSLVKIADGIYATSFPDLTDASMNGNGVVIVNDSDVLVVDTQNTPEAARRVIAEIRKITGKPVRYVINTHWHGDHHFGNMVYRDAFPGVEFISHPNTREDTDKEMVPILRALADTGLSNQAALLERTLAAGKGADGGPLSPAARAYYEKNISLYRWWNEQLRRVTIVTAGLTVADSLEFVRGDRRIIVRYLGRGNTRGDLSVWLPKERVLVAGDLLVNPIPYGFGSFLGEWISVLDKLRATDAQVIVPGHGPIEHDFNYLAMVRALLESTLSQTRAAAAKGLDLEATRTAVNLDSLRSRFTEGKAALIPAFNANFTVPAVERAWLEATGRIDRKP